MMKIINRCILMLIAILVASKSVTVHAEYREWTDNQGNRIKAEYVGTSIDSVVLRKEDGSEIKVSLDSLSDQDRRYALLQVPPRVDIKFASNVQRKNVGYVGNRAYSSQILYEIVSPSVKLKKSSVAPYEAPLRLEVVIIGKVQTTDRYVVLDNATKPFTFTAENRNQYDYEGNPIDLGLMRGSLKGGVEYDGYLVVIRDYTGTIIEKKASRSELEEHAEAILKAKAGTLFTEDLKAIEPRRPSRSGNTALPGRWY